MRLRLWHARWAVPWHAIAACLAVAALGAALTSWQQRMAYVVLPLIALLTAAGVAFVLDDPAGDVTRVTARGSHWATVNRLAVAAVVALVGFGFITLALGEIGGLHGWPVVLTALALAAIAIAAWRVRRHQRTPGSAVASALVLLGLVPFVASRLFSGAWPYPSPVLEDAARDRWLVLAAVAAIALAWAVLRPLPGPPRGLHAGVRTDARADVPTDLPADARTRSRV